MGLGFTIHTKIKDIEKFQQAVESQAVESGYNAEHDESSSTVSFCRLGDLFLSINMREKEIRTTSFP